MARASTDNHFITVSRRGELMARRKGQRPVRVATSEAGLLVATDRAAPATGVPETLRVHFEHGGGNRTLCVTSVVTPDGLALEVDAFLARYAVPEPTFALWIRRAIDDALDRAAGAEIVSPGGRADR